MDFISAELTEKLKEKGFHTHIQYSYYNQIARIRTISIYPTISQVLKWLREEKEIDFVIKPIFKYDNDERVREYGCDVFSPSLNKPINIGYYNLYTDACLAGIEYVIDNLI